MRVREEGQQVRGGGWKWGTDLVTGEISATHAGLGSRKGLERRVWYSGERGAESQWRDASEATVHTSPSDSWVPRSVLQAGLGAWGEHWVGSPQYYGLGPPATAGVWVGAISLETGCVWGAPRQGEE